MLHTSHATDASNSAKHLHTHMKHKTSKQQRCTKYAANSQHSLEASEMTLVDSMLEPCAQQQLYGPDSHRVEHMHAPADSASAHSSCISSGCS